MSGHIGDLTAEQEQALCELRERTQNMEEEDLREYAKGFCNDGIYLRFLRARKFDVDAAADMLMETMRFRTSFQEMGVDAITVDDVPNELRTGKSFFYGKDIQGRPVCYVKVKNHDPSKVEQKEGQRFSLFMMEYGRTLLEPPVETVTMVFDMSECGMKNMDTKALQFTIQSLQNHYPESLGRVLVYNSSWFVYGVWKVVKPWLDVVTAAKVVFIDKKNIKDYICEDNLPEEYGGKQPFKYDAVKFTEEVSTSMAAVASGHPQP